MSSDSENDDIFISKVNANVLNLLSEKSKKKYETAYKIFMKWRSQNSIESISESILLTYFEELSKKYKPTSLWTHYSILKSILNRNNDIKIHRYAKLRAFLKCKYQGYVKKRAKTFTADEIKRFIKDAPDSIYLATKVALIMAIMGACRAHELYSININDVEDLKSAIIVTIRSNNEKQFVRKFTITNNFYEICKKYSDLRPSDSTSYFVNYQNSKCTKQKIGINKFRMMGKEIARYLKLPNPEMYTAHTFRQSSKRNGLWQYTEIFGDESRSTEVETNDTTEPTYNLRQAVKNELKVWECTSETEDLEDSISMKEENIIDQPPERQTTPVNEILTDMRNSGEITRTQEETNNFKKTESKNKCENREIPSITIKNCSNMTIILVNNKINT